MNNLIDSKVKPGFKWPLIVRIAFALIGLLCCSGLVVDSATMGIARLFTTLAIIQPGIEPADTAVRLSPADPQAHYTRALSLVNLQRLSDAVVELRRAIELRPHHYYQWLDLGVTLDRLGDQDGATVALRESVRLAPFYAQPRWQLGNLLFRQGLYPEAFEDLRLAARSDSSLSEGLLRLGWVAAGGDIARFEQMIQPETSQERFRVAAFLSREGQGTEEAVNQVRLAGKPQDETEATYLRQTITQLLAAEKYRDAYVVWATTHAPSDGQITAAVGQVVNGDFTDPISQNDPGFGWQLSAVPSIAMSIDPSGPRSGVRSIRIEYQGDSSPASQPIRQLVLVAKNSRYSLSFMVRTHELVTGGAPVIAVFDGTPAARLLARSEPIAVRTGEWTSHRVDFDVDEATPVVNIALQRQPCNQSPCPVFGEVWLSDLSLTKR